MINKRDLIRSRTPVDTELRYQLSQIPNKVDKEPNKGLSTNDFTNEYKGELDKTIQNVHHHNNLGILNSISSDDLEDWNSAYYITNQLIDPTELYSNEVGSSANITFDIDPSNYLYLFIIYGSETDYDNKIITPTNKQFCIALNDVKSFYKINGLNLEKQSGSDTILIYKVLGYFEKGEVLNGRSRG